LAVTKTAKKKHYFIGSSIKLLRKCQAILAAKMSATFLAIFSNYQGNTIFLCSSILAATETSGRQDKRVVCVCYAGPQISLAMFVELICYCVYLQLWTSITGSQKISPYVNVASGIAKMFVGELIETGMFVIVAL